jgi:hypothetical protein
LIIFSASRVPATRERIFANAFWRVVEVSSQNGEKPQSSVDWDVSHCLQDAVAYFFGLFYPRIDG